MLFVNIRFFREVIIPELSPSAKYHTIYKKHEGYLVAVHKEPLFRAVLV